MANIECEEPPDVVDRLLWRDAQRLLDRHSEPDAENTCAWCGWRWPCPPRRLAERAEEASRREWRESWTARHDLNGIRALPSWSTDAVRRSGTTRMVGVTRRLNRYTNNRGPTRT